MPQMFFSPCKQNAELTQCALYLYLNFCMVSSNYLKALAAMRQNMTDPTRRLQLIATDTWDISDDLSKYNVSDLLEVSRGWAGGRRGG
jgi:hypothetical protein